MYQAIVAFERKSNCDRIRELLESTGEFSCLACRSADQIKRAVRKLRLDLVVCGFKLGAESCESIYHDLPQRCVVLMVAPQAQLDLCEGAGIFKLPTPIRRSELLASARLLAQMGQGRNRACVQRSPEERDLVEQAKGLLIRCGGMTEEQAHRFLQKRSMDSGARLADTARQVLEGTILGQGRLT